MAAAKMNPPSTPLPIPRDEETQYLSERINTSTRSTHTQLNRLIIARLPIALPPHTSDPSLYTSGLLHIAPIYITFESLWQNFISTHLPTKLCAEQEHKLCGEETPPKACSANNISSLSVHQKNICSNTDSALSQLLLPGLLRSERLRSDIKSLSGKSSQEIEEELSHVSQNAPALTRFIEHIENSVVVKPHLFVAYAWVLYMALFSGGRFLRASLKNAGTDSWLRSPSQSPSAAQSPQNIVEPLPTGQETLVSGVHDHNPHHFKGLTLESESCAQEKARTQTLHQFFHFPGVQDGEDTKREFKKRIAEIDILLSDGEKDEIVQEAQHIFNFMVGIVGDLDAVCNTKVEQGKEKSTEVPVSTRVEGGDGISTIAREWLSSANLTLRSGRQDARRLLVFRAASRMVNFGMKTLWKYSLSLFMGRGFDDQRV